MGPTNAMMEFVIDVRHDMVYAAIDPVRNLRRARRLCKGAGGRRKRDQSRERSSCDQFPKHQILPTV